MSFQLGDRDKTTIQEAVSGAVGWLEAHSGTATLEEVEDKQSGKAE